MKSAFNDVVATTVSDGFEGDFCFHWGWEAKLAH